MSKPREIVRAGQFKRDVKLAEKRHKDLTKLRGLLLLLIEGEALPPRYKDHALSGDWNRYRECHIEPDWLLIDKIDGNDLYLVRTGTHADLF